MSDVICKHNRESRSCPQCAVENLPYRLSINSKDANLPADVRWNCAQAADKLTAPNQPATPDSEEQIGMLESALSDRPESEYNAILASLLELQRIRSAERPEPVAWRWKPKTGTIWHYDPEDAWLARQKDADIDKDPLYGPELLDAYDRMAVERDRHMGAVQAYMDDAEAMRQRAEAAEPDLKRIRSAERPEEPDIVRLHRLNPIPAHQAHRVDPHHFHVATAHIDALSDYADRMAAENAKLKLDLHTAVSQGMAAESKLARVVEGLREPTPEMMNAAIKHVSASGVMSALGIWEAMSAELLRQIEGDK